MQYFWERYGGICMWIVLLPYLLITILYQTLRSENQNGYTGLSPTFTCTLNIQKLKGCLIVHNINLLLTSNLPFILSQQIWTRSTGKIDLAHGIIHHTLHTCSLEWLTPSLLLYGTSSLLSLFWWGPKKTNKSEHRNLGTASLKNHLFSQVTQTATKSFSTCTTHPHRTSLYQ